MFLNSSHKKFVAAAVVLCLVVVLSCRKKPVPEPEPEPLVSTELQSGFPADIKAINGYVYASNYSVSHTQAYYNQRGSRAYATFSDPAKNLTKSFNHLNDFFIHQSTHVGNVSVGELHVNSVKLFTVIANNNTHFYDFSNNNTRFSSPVKWSLEGNNAYTAAEITLPSFPEVKHDGSFPSFSQSRDTTINLEGLFFNYDSARVELNINSDFIIVKNVTSKEKSVTFRKEEYPASLFGSTLKFSLFKYYNKVTNNRTYLYELSTKYTISTQWTP